MTSYNVRIADDTALDVSVPEDYKPADHSVRLLRLINNDLVIGTIVGTSTEKNYAVMTFPMFVDVLHCDDHDEEEEYELIPYIRNMIEFDPQFPRPIPFNLDLCINAVEPSMHLVKNYYKTLLAYKAVSNEMLGLNHVRETMH